MDIMKKWIYNKRYECMWLIILVLYMVYYLPMPSELHSFCTAPYVLRYDLGFISRGLIGSFWGIFFPYISQNTIWVIIGLNQVILCVITVIFLSTIKKYITEDTDKGIIYLAFVFLTNPASVAFLFYWGNYGRMDLFMIAGTIISAVLLIKKRLLWLIPIICVAIMAIHQGFTFSYFPCILLMLGYYFITQKKGKKVLIVTFVAGCIAFLYFQFFGKITGISLEETLNILSARTNYPLAYMESMVELEYFTDILGFIPVYVLPVLKKNAIKIIFVMILLLPLEYMLFGIWKRFVSESKNKYFWIFPVFVIIATLPKFIITCDYGRDIASIIISQFIMIFTFYAMESRPMRVAIAELQQKIIKNPTIACFSLIELAIIGKFEAANILNITNTMYKVVEKLF